MAVKVLNMIEDQSYGLQRHQNLHIDYQRFLINYSSLFFDSIYLDEKNSLQADSNFIRTFIQYSKDLSFELDESENIIFSDHTQYQIIKLLFEGQTRRMSSVNFLRSLYQPILKRIQV